MAKQMPREEQMTDKALVDLIWRKLRSSLNSEEGDLQEERADLFARYYGAIDAENENRPDLSSYQTREILEVIEWAQPSIVRVLLHGHKVVEFEPSTGEDEEAAAQETDVVNYRVLRANDGDGWIELHNFIKNALMFPNAYAKVFVEEMESTTTHEGMGISVEGVMALTRNPEIEIQERNIRQEMGIPVFDLRWTETKTRHSLKIMTVPGDEILIDDDLDTLNLDAAEFIAHRQMKTKTDLMMEGYSEEDLKRATAEPENEDSYGTERYTRFFYEDENSGLWGDDDEDDTANRKYWVYECHMKVDYDGDGMAERRKIVVIGNEVFDNEEMDYNPFVSMGAIAIPNKHVQLSLAQIVRDIQRLNSLFFQQMANNINRINISKQVISENSLIDDGSTLDAILDSANPFVVVAGAASEAVVPIPTSSLVSDILPVIQDVRQQASMRTGIAPENAVDKNVLQQSTVGAFMGAMQKQSERLELIIRLMAETGIQADIQESALSVSHVSHDLGNREAAWKLGPGRSIRLARAHRHES